IQLYAHYKFIFILLFFILLPLSPSSSLFPYTTLFRSHNNIIRFTIIRIGRNNQGWVLPPHLSSKRRREIQPYKVTLLRFIHPFLSPPELKIAIPHLLLFEKIHLIKMDF